MDERPRRFRLFAGILVGLILLFGGLLLLLPTGLAEKGAVAFGVLLALGYGGGGLTHLLLTAYRFPDRFPAWFMWGLAGLFLLLLGGAVLFSLVLESLSMETMGLVLRGLQAGANGLLALLFLLATWGWLILFKKFETNGGERETEEKESASDASARGPGRS